MSRWKIPYDVVRVALFELAHGATIDGAGAAAGVSPRSVDRFVREHGRMTVRETHQRSGVLMVRPGSLGVSRVWNARQIR